MSTVQSRYNFDRIDRRTRRITPALITAVKDRIVERLRPRKVVLFGSQASGRATRDSDIDLLVVLDDRHPFAPLKRRDRFGQLLELFPYRSFGLDAIVVIEAEIKELQDKNEGEWDLVLEALKEGRSLYDYATETQTERTHPPADTGVVSQG